VTLSKPENFDAEAPSADGQRSLRSNPSIYPQPGSVEFSAPLENSVSLEAPRQVYAPVLTQPLSLQTELPLQADVINEQMPAASQSIVAEETIQLLEERLIVNRIKRKVGEVIVRKEIETQIVEVPVRREKLIIEQVSPEYKHLAVVDLGQMQEEEIATKAASALFPSIVEGRFTSTSAAIQFLEAIAAQPHSGLQSVQISVEMKDATSRSAYQQLLEQYSVEIIP
jgi:hypothetical protein